MNKKMKLSKKEIAELFSNGKFDNITGYLNDKIVWNVVGENTFEGKKAVLENCEQIARYFLSVQTEFKTDSIIASGNNVVVRGTAEFSRDGKRINFISACDVYEFNDNHELEKINSYCIPEKK